MKKNKTRFKLALALVVLSLMFTVVLAEPGTEDDPLITKSYIDDVLMPKIEKYVESAIAGLKTGGSGTGAAAVFEVVEASEGQEIICSAGTELILRMGKATIIATEKGGLADTTAGFDLADGTDMPSNHLLIVPVADGRGIRANSDIIVMIKGGFTKK
ncbi:MAG: hypothetical protein IJW15_01875 [Clostridia bacterium]|nr:hypothetical protein [Clostridia bacterium]